MRKTIRQEENEFQSLLNGNIQSCGSGGPASTDFLLPFTDRCESCVGMGDKFKSIKQCALEKEEDQTSRTFKDHLLILIPAYKEVPLL